MYTQKPFVDAANAATLRAAYDPLVGSGRWSTCSAIGTFAVRFPSPVDPGDGGWHIDMSDDWEQPDLTDWRARIVITGVGRDVFITEVNARRSSESGLGRKLTVNKTSCVCVETDGDSAERSSRRVVPSFSSSIGTIESIQCIEEVAPRHWPPVNGSEHFHV
jgi:hypothetical protein